MNELHEANRQHQGPALDECEQHWFYTGRNQQDAHRFCQRHEFALVGSGQFAREL